MFGNTAGVRLPRWPGLARGGGQGASEFLAQRRLEENATSQLQPMSTLATPGHH